MPGLVVSSDSGFAVIRMAGKCRVVMANAVRPSVSKEIASVVSLHRNDKFRIVMANAVRPSVSKEIASVVSLHRNDKIRIVMANAVWRSVSKEIAAPCIQHGSQQEACGKFSRECQEPLVSVKMRKRAV